VAVLAISFAKNGKLTSLAFSFDAINTASSIHRANACHKLFCDGLALFATKDVSIALSSSRLPPMSEFHTVQGIQCREVANELPIVGSVIVLEATADAQEELVDECLELEEDDENDSKQKRIAEGDPYGCVWLESCVSFNDVFSFWIMIHIGDWFLNILSHPST
jgi:hypothetical protein